MSFDRLALEGKIALVTGGTDGIGRATAALMALRGAQLLITGRDPKRLGNALEEISGARGCVSDASVTQDIENLGA